MLIGYPSNRNIVRVISWSLPPRSGSAVRPALLYVFSMQVTYVEFVGLPKNCLKGKTNSSYIRRRSYERASGKTEIRWRTLASPSPIIPESSSNILRMLLVYLSISLVWAHGGRACPNGRFVIVSLQ
jgi:hypothetical protein